MSEKQQYANQYVDQYIFSSPQNKWETVLEQYIIDNDDVGSAPDFIQHYFPKKAGMPARLTYYPEQKIGEPDPQIKCNPPDIDCFLHLWVNVGKMWLL